MAQPCSNTERTINNERSPCLKSAPNVCKGCFLVQYCSKECQLSHWSIHKADCKSPLMKSSWKPRWETEGRVPAFVDGPGTVGTSFGQSSHGLQKYLWGNVPAIDLLKLKQNEGLDYTKNFRLLFAASGDIRNLVKSLAEVPVTYTGHVETILNDKDSDIVARNAILLLIALHFNPDEAAPIMLHIWYSALIPSQMLHLLRENLLPLVQDVCTKIKAKPAKSLQSKTWIFDSRSLRLVLRKEHWDYLLQFFEIPQGLSMQKAQTVRAATMLAPDRKDYVDRALYNQPPWWRVCTMKFRIDGILLPFGLSRAEFDTPNPTFYQSRDNWPMLDSADPLQGWPVDEVLKKAPAAKNDIYGSLFFYLQGILLKFCHQIRRIKFSIQIFQADARELPSVYKLGQHSFDRIEVSNVGDRGYIGPEIVLATFSPLLKRKTHNPYATLVALFLNAVPEVSNDADTLRTVKSSAKMLLRYLQPNGKAPNPDKMSAEFIRFVEASKLFQDYDAIFERFMRECKLDRISKASGLDIKAINTIVQPWPMRIKTNATQQEFDMLLASGHIGLERYMEWVNMF